MKSILRFILIIFVVLFVFEVIISAKKITYTTRSGMISKNETWSGNILITDTVVIPHGRTVTVQPGAVVKFKHYRGYKNPDKVIGIFVEGGTLKAVGTANNQIRFTSDAKKPINGDWSGIRIYDSTDSKFEYAVIEFGEIGIAQFDSSVAVKNSIIRWSNSEGLYAERSQPVFMNNTLYENAYHEIALEQFNTNVQVINNVFRNGKGLHWAIHCEKTEAVIKNNYFSGYDEVVISAGMESRLTISNNAFVNLTGNAKNVPIDIYDGSKARKSGNKFNKKGKKPVFNYKDKQNYKLGYIPGDKKDKYMYIYPNDKTRKTVKKLGKGLSFGWALLYAEGYLWRFSLGSGEIGDGLDLIRINPKNGKYIRFGTNDIMNPRGLAFDGEYFYVNDFSLLKIFKFKLPKNASKGDFIKVEKSFNIPDKNSGGVMGLTTDGAYLYLTSRNLNKIYKLDKNGRLKGKIGNKNSEFGSSITYADGFFWMNGGCSKGICKFTKTGKLVGEIYPAAKDTWAMAYDGKYLWTIQRTSEAWDDPKIYKIQILDDSLD